MAIGVLPQILAMGGNHPLSDLEVIAAYQSEILKVSYINERLNYLAQAEECPNLSRLGKKFNIDNFDLFTPQQKIRAIYERYQKISEYISIHMPSRFNIFKASFPEFKDHILAYNRLQFWKKLPGGKEYLETSEMQNISNIVEKASKFSNWIKKHFEVRDLTILNLGNAHLIEKLPPEINLFHKLQELNLQNNQLTNLPTNFYLPNLLDLNLQNNYLTTLPQDFNPTRLVWLNLNDNPIIEFPENFDPPGLQWLFVQNTLLKSLPKNFDTTRFNIVSIKSKFLVLHYIDQNIRERINNCRG